MKMNMESISKQRAEKDAQMMNSQIGNKTSCEKCKGKTVVYEAVYDEDLGYWSCIGKRCECYTSWRNKELARKSGIESLLYLRRFDNFETTESWQKFMYDKAINYKDGWFFVGGAVGSGKSHICTAIMGKYINSGIPSLYMLWMDESKKLKRLVNDIRYTEEIEKYKTTKVLYIDDLFKVGDRSVDRVSDGDIKLAFEILNYRYINNLKTIISSEFMYQEIEDIDEAVASRIKQMSDRNCISITPDRNKNYRLKKGAF